MNVNDINKKALAQTYYIIENMSKANKSEIPLELINCIYENMDKDYVFEDKILDETQKLLYAILIKYILDDEMKRKIKEHYNFYSKKKLNLEVNNMEKNIAEKMYIYYNSLLSKKDCEDLAEDIMEAAKEEKYNKILNEWLNDNSKYNDIEIKGFSIVEIAKKLDREHPNIPIAILLCYLAENNLPEYQCILAIADEMCLADYKLIEEGKICQTAIFNDGGWYFFSDNTNADDLRECQKWQILLLNPLLAPQIVYEHKNNTSICLQDDGRYLIMENDN